MKNREKNIVIIIHAQFLFLTIAFFYLSGKREEERFANYYVGVSEIVANLFLNTEWQLGQASCLGFFVLNSLLQ